jgi:hypothetical protein
MPMAKKMTVAVGNRYSKVDGPERVWVIKKIYTPSGFTAHVRMFCEEKPDDVRIYGCSVIEDRRFFIPV